MQLSGIKSIVTGGASGLGLACAKAFVSKGAEVYVADIDEENGKRAASMSGITFLPTDVTKEDEVAAMLDRIEADGEPARVLVNCAGIAPLLSLWRGDDLHCLDAFELVLKTNITGTFLPVSRFAYRLRDAEPIGEEVGVIINTSSVTAFDGQAGHVAYAASKGAVAAMTLPLARDLSRVRIRAVSIAAGLFDTPMLKNVPNSHKVELGSQVPHPQRLGRPEEFATLVRHIVENPMLNGDVIRLDGALRMTPW